MPAKHVSEASTTTVDDVLARMSHALGPDWMAAMGVQPETVRTWRKRGEVPARQLMRAAQQAGRPLEYFSGTSGLPSTAPQRQADEDEFTQIEMLDAHISAGHGAVNGPHEVIGRFAFRSSWLQSRGLGRHNAKIVRARGRSMADRINDGDILLVNTSVDTLTQDGVYVIELEGENYVKLLERDFGTGGVRIVSYNPAYPPQVLEGEAANRLRICGRVIWHGGEL
ncbi:MAG: LexA family transcriptional regulator [Burkholderiaceae bacterium]|jgi:phage repressor protein C with HTH and peptisase S24 domain|nr:LexA family transcriptional regulator [Burkholderiaceae bacterium]